ncbi:PA domain-containing protein [Plasmodiophora brassicae]|uniref:Uncharacterized protein n=1 Tax=Plasmodiophora brassicae TaxID=37360 RepID=A0A0G4IQE1_PLABS|nr:hypothetical protein PBRA_000777 [Plasmodiophora brassicae]
MRCDALCVWVALDTYIRYARVWAAITFPMETNGPLAGASVYSPPLTQYIGPQPEDPMDPVLATLIVYQGNICNADTVDADVVRDKAVVVGPNFETACSQEQTYLAFQSKGAAAILSWSYTPGNMVYSHDGSRGARTRALKMLSLEFAYTDDVYNAMVGTANLTVSLLPDPNVWVPAFASAPYQIFLRWLPACMLSSAGIAAMVFGVVHYRRMHEKYMHDVPESAQSLRRWFEYLQPRLGPQHLALIVESVSATTLGVVAFAIGGFFSTPNLPAPAMLFFTTLMSGFGYVSTIMSSIVWSRQLHRALPTSSATSRVASTLRGDYPWATALLCLIPLAIDTFMSVLYAAYFETSLTDTLNSLMFAGLQIMVSGHLIFSVRAYYKEARLVTFAAANDRPVDSALQGVLRRLSRCALGLSVSMLIYVAGLVVMATSPAFFYSPTGWTLTWSCVVMGRALDSIFRVLMFMPRLIWQSGMPTKLQLISNKSGDNNRHYASGKSQE